MPSELSHLRIECLSDRRDLVPTVAGWIYDEWAYLMAGKSLEEWTCDLRGELGEGPIPETFVAILEEEPVGTASLISQDLELREDLSPWLARVYVRSEYRRMGIATALIARVVEEGRALGVGTLYLYTFDREAFYSQRGWSAVERTQYHGKEITVMSR